MVFSGAPTPPDRNHFDSPNPTFHIPMGPERSRPLHNFSLPCLKWGGQKHLRCVRLQDGHRSNHFPPLPRRSPPTYAERKRRSVYEVDDSWTSTEIGRSLAIGADVEAVRKKLMLDLQTEMDKMKFAVLTEGADKVAPPPTTTVPAEERPWNLRTRRAVCKEPNANGGSAGGKSQRVEEVISSLSPTKSPARRSDVGSVEDYIGGIKRPRDKFSISLWKHEIEEDFIAITGVRPPRKPKKRSRTVQRQLDAVFPGLWISEITADMYKVKENPEGRKR